LNERIAHVVGVAPPLVPVPFAIARWGSKIGEWAFRSVLRRPPFVPAFFVEIMAHMQHYDCSKARRELDYPRSNLDRAIEDAVIWFRNNGYL
jgi:dihydroflavonol-4-reductase